MRSKVGRTVQTLMKDIKIKTIKVKYYFKSKYSNIDFKSVHICRGVDCRVSNDYKTVNMKVKLYLDPTGGQ